MFVIWQKRKNWFLKLSSSLLFLLWANSSIAEQLTASNFTRNFPIYFSILEKNENTSFENVDDVDRGSGAEIFKRVFPSVVKILTDKGQGSGIIVTNDTRLILTNYHVISGHSSVGIVFPNDNNSEKLNLANVIKYDEIKDLALLQLNENRRDLIPLAISKNLPMIGEDVHAVGHPLGEDWTYTRGYISQLRDNYSWSTDVDEHHVANVIQTQTPINPGNSGGPLVNEDAELVGINTFGNRNAQGLNFSVAVSSIMEFFNSDGDKSRITLPKNSELFGEMLDSSDENKNGNPDFYTFDYNYNSAADTYIVDKNEDLQADMLLLDQNENSIIEIRVEYMMFEGSEIAIYMLDQDEDKVFEARGIDSDLDGKLDYVEPIN